MIDGADHDEDGDDDGCGDENEVEVFCGLGEVNVLLAFPSLVWC